MIYDLFVPLAGTVHLGRIAMKIAFAFLAIAPFAAVLPSPAAAAWRVAETAHFIYYSEAPEAELVQTVTRMETFDKLVRALTGNTRPSSPVKVTMFEVASMDDVNASLPYESQGVGGYFSTTAQGPFLVTFRNTLRQGRNSAFRAAKQSITWGPEVRQHEYLHSYMYQYFNANYPTWYSEGFAEYYGSMTFPEPGIVEIGHAPHFRMDTILRQPWLPVAKLLTAKSYADIDNVGMLYAEGWLLTHYAAQKPARGKQLQQYLKSVATGMAYDQAAKDAFGDLDALDKELKKHARDLKAVRLSLKPVDVGKVAIRELPPVEDAMMRYRIRLNSGFAYSTLPLAVRTVRAARAADPTNLKALHIQAQLENLAGMEAEALKTAEAILAQDPRNVWGLTEKGKAMVGMLTRQSNAAAWAAARAPLEQAARLDTLAIEPRVALYRSYEGQGTLADVDAQNRLVEAFNLLPQDDDIRYLLARDFEQRGMLDDAIKVIEPAAFGSFDGDEGKKKKRERARAQAAERYTNISNYESPRDMLARLTAKKEGRWDEAKQAVKPAANI